MGEGIVRESGMDMDTLLYLTRRTNKDLLSSTGNSAQSHVAAWMGGELAGGMDARLCKADSLCCSPEIIITLLTGYAPKQNEKFGKKKIGIEAFSSTVEGWYLARQEQLW